MESASRVQLALDGRLRFTFSNERAGKVYSNNQVIINKQFYGIMTLNRRWMCSYIWLYGINKLRNGLAEISFNFNTNEIHASIGDAM